MNEQRKQRFAHAGNGRQKRNISDSTDTNYDEDCAMEWFNVFQILCFSICLLAFYPPAKLVNVKPASSKCCCRYCMYYVVNCMALCVCVV